MAPTPRSVAALLLLLLMASATRIAAQTSTQDLKRMSLQDLLNIELSTVSRMPEQVSTIPAAVFVITQEDIRRSGATSLPEVLRLAPGIQVARIDAGKWAIGIRGFADRLARSMLVLIDGRAVYSPLFAGTYWESQDTLLDDIDRIEVIRGPGGTLWGANAVNGIINIITKTAKDTTGVLVDVGGGSQDRGFGGVRYGGSSGALSYRAYVKGFDRASEFHPDGIKYDGWQAGQGGFRADWALSNNRTFTLQGDVYSGRLAERASVATYTSPFTQTSMLDAPVSGGNVLGRFNGSAGGKGSYQLQVYYDRTSREEIPVSEDRDTIDVDFQHSLRPWHRNTAVWGAGYRVTSGRITAVDPTFFLPDRRTDSLYSAFLQDEITIVPDRWRLTLGSKIEHNDYSGVEVQPSARLLWTPDTVNTFFSSVTRAVRTPSRVETDYTTTSLISAGDTPTFVRLVPDPAFSSERLIAYELGYRARPIDQLYVTFAAYYNDLHDMLSTELLTAFVETTPPPPARVILPVMFGNGLDGNSHGATITADARAAEWWRMTAAYSYLSVAMSKQAGSRDVSQEGRYEGLVPHHQVQVGSSVDVRGGWSFDWLLRFVSDLPAASIPSYATSNLRVAWRIMPTLEWSVVGQDLNHAHHVEWPSGSGANVEVQRSVYTRLTWRR